MSYMDFCIKQDKENGDFTVDQIMPKTQESENDLKELDKYKEEVRLLRQKQQVLVDLNQTLIKYVNDFVDSVESNLKVLDNNTKVIREICMD